MPYALPNGYLSPQAEVQLVSALSNTSVAVVDMGSFSQSRWTIIGDGGIGSCQSEEHQSQPVRRPPDCETCLGPSTPCIDKSGSGNSCESREIGIRVQSRSHTPRYFLLSLCHLSGIIVHKSRTPTALVTTQERECMMLSTPRKR